MQVPVAPTEDNTASNPVPDIQIYNIGSSGKSERVFLVVTIEGCKFVSLADTGADVTLISRSTLEKMKDRKSVV